MRGRTSSTRWSAVLDSKDAQVVARFYRELLGTLIDPAGHIFDLWLNPAEPD